MVGIKKCSQHIDKEKHTQTGVVMQNTPISSDYKRYLLLHASVIVELTVGNEVQAFDLSLKEKTHDRTVGPAYDGISRWRIHKQ